MLNNHITSTRRTSLSPSLLLFVGITNLFSIMSCSMSGDQSENKPTSQTRRAVPIVEVYHYSITNPMFLLLTVSL